MRAYESRKRPISCIHVQDVQPPSSTGTSAGMCRRHQAVLAAHTHSFTHWEHSCMLLVLLLSSMPVQACICCQPIFGLEVDCSFKASASFVLH